MRILCRIHREANNVVTSKKIAEKEELSPGVVLKILRQLSAAGIVHAYQGRGEVCGGFSLARSIDDITMADIIVALEGMDIGENLDEASGKKVKALDQACNQINEELMKLFSGYGIVYLLESNDWGTA